MLKIGTALLAITLSVVAAPAPQAVPAPLGGTVYDVGGGVIPGVTLALVDAKGTRVAATSNASGRFEFPAVAPGRFVLEATLLGFTSLRHEFELRNARDWDRAVTLQLGDLEEVLYVRATRLDPLPPPSPGLPRAPIRVGGSVRVPQKAFDVKPIYPDTMRRAGFSGVVPIEAVIGKDGSVSSVRVMSAQVHPDLAIAAANAVRQWRYQPTLLNGVPVEVVMTVTVRFDLE